MRTGCPHCGAVFAIPVENLGRKARCSRCKGVFVVEIYTGARTEDHASHRSFPVEEKELIEKTIDRDLLQDVSEGESEPRKDSSDKNPLRRVFSFYSLFCSLTALSLVMVLFGFIWYSQEPVTPQQSSGIQDLPRQVSELQSQFTALERAGSRIGRILTGLEQRQQQLDDRIGSADQQVNLLKARMGGLDSEGGKLRDQLHSSMEEVKQLRTRIETISAADSSSGGTRSSREESPEDVLRAYLEAPAWKDRLRFVDSPEKLAAPMEQYYEGNYKPVERCRIYPVNTSGVKAGESFSVKVRIGDNPVSPYVMVRTPKGFRVAWLQSRALRQQHRDDLKAEYGLVNAEIQVSVISLRPLLPDGTVIELEVKNGSDALVSYWNISMAVYDDAGEVLGYRGSEGSFLKTADTAQAEIILDSVQPADIEGWDMKLEGLHIETASGDEYDVLPYFSLREIK